MKLLTIDYSTTSTGYAIFEDSKLVSYGKIKNKAFGKIKNSNLKTITRLKYMAEEICKIIPTNLDMILIEEVNRGISRIGQKTLSAGHYFLLEAIHIGPNLLNKVEYIDSDGRDGWRPELGLRLTEKDKKFNRKKSTPKKDRITKKHLICRYISFSLELSLNPKDDNDIADAIGIGLGYLKKNGLISLRDLASYDKI